MGISESSLSKIRTYSPEHKRRTSGNLSLEHETKTLLFVECTTDLDLKCATSLLKGDSPCFRIHLTMPEFSNMDRIVDMTVIKHLNEDLFFHALDISDEMAVEETVKNIVKMEGKIDVLVCSFDARTGSMLETTSTEEVKTAFSRNLFPHIRIVQAVLPHMKKQRKGNIVAISNFAGLQGLPYHSVYCASRFGVEGFFESIAAECAAHNIHVTMLETAIQKKATPDLPSLNLTVNKRLRMSSPGDDFEFSSHIESKLTEQEMMKKIKADKVVDAIREIVTTRVHSLRYYLNKSALDIGKSRFIDYKGTRQLNEVTKFFLNLELENVKEPTRSVHTILCRTKTS